MTTTWNAIDTLTKTFDLSEIGPSDTAVLVVSPATDRALRDCAVLALERLGATVTVVMVHNDPGRVLERNPAAAAAMQAADIVINLARRRLGPTSELDRVLGDRARLLDISVRSPSELAALSPHAGLSQRLERARALLARSASLSIVSTAGTAVAVDLTGAAVHVDAGIAAETSTRASWPAGEVVVEPRPAGIAGTVVLMPGDLLIGPDVFVRSPVRLSLDKSHVVEIQGDSGDADLLRSVLETRGPDGDYLVRRLRLGLNYRRGRRSPDPFDPSMLGPGAGARTAGVVGLMVGGERPLTIGLRGCSSHLDDLPIALDGVLQGGLAPDVYEQASLR